MSLNYLAQFLRLHAILFSALLALAGCLPTGEADVPDDTGNNGGEIESDQQIVGSVGDGPIVSASILVRTQDGTQIGTASSGSTADFDIVVKTRGSNYPLRIDASGGTDLVTSTAPDFTLRSSVLKPGKRVVANINPFTTFAMELASDLPGGRTEENIESALTTVSSKLNSGLTTLLGTAAMTTEVDADNIAELMRASEALGEAVRRSRDSLASVGRTVSGDNVVAAVASDLSDGVIDGRGGFGADARISAVFGMALSQVMLETMQNELQVQGVDATGRINAAMSQVFAGIPSPTLAELRVSAEMLDGLDNGLLAAEWLQPTPALASLRSEVAAVTAGMTSGQVRALLNSDATAELAASLVSAAGASAADIDLLNTVLRTGFLPSDNIAPVISGIPPVSVEAGTRYSFQPSASDADNDSLTFSIAGRPAWAQFDTTSGQLQGVPGSNDLGINTGIVISVTDGQDTVSLPAFSIAVTGNVNLPPTIIGSPLGSVVANSAYSFTPTAADPDGDALTFSISNRPSWASFSTQTGTLSGTPGDNDVGAWSGIQISVSDGSATATLPAFAITVLPFVNPNNPPQISGTPSLSIDVGDVYTFQPTASDPDGDALTFNISNRPAWASFDPASGTLSGSPLSANVGSFANIMISVTDGTDTVALAPFTITVNAAANGVPQISGTPSLSIDVGGSYSFRPTASDPDGDALTFSISNRPSWAAFDTANGTLSGVPVSADAGSYANITISVSDGTDSASLAPFTITVNALPVNTPPEILGDPQTLVLVGSLYDFQPTASDADGDSLTFSVSGLPAWASFDSATARLYGTPSAADVGVYSNVSITVSDGEDSATLGPFSISVDEITLGSATLSWTPPTQNTDGTPLTDLAGFRIYWGTSSGNYPNSVTINNPGVTTYVVENLAPGTYEFVSTALNSSGIESGYSNPASKTIP